MDEKKVEKIDDKKIKAKEEKTDDSPITEKSVKSYYLSDLSSNNNQESASLQNLDIVMDLPMEVNVQIGKAKKRIREIIEFTQGSIIELDKQAGDPVDIIVNNELIARGDVIVIDDIFGVRITEIVK
ncbi:MAG: flagellar motor switch protein FliN [Oscillospiraceae bacterium]|jgi:flagellar motor switch protein FliN/FliY|nr:flagellar motor switch protein FliN [Oscillospiraceae bacterium]